MPRKTQAGARGIGLRGFLKPKPTVEPDPDHTGGGNCTFFSQAAHRAAFLHGEHDMKRLALFIILCCAFFRPTLVLAGPPELLVMTHDSFSLSTDVLAEFEQTNACAVRILQAGDAGAALNQAILSKNSPLADVFYGVDNTFLSRALKAGIFESHVSPGLAAVPAALRLDPSNTLLPMDFGDVCLNYDRSWFAARQIAPPSSLEDLLKPELKGLTVVQNPATSSPGLAFLLATIGHFGEDKAFEFWKGLKRNDVLITAGWKEAYWGEFTAASKGKRPIVVSYATSPAAEVHFSDTPLDIPPTSAVLSAGSAFRQIEFAGILKGAAQPELARKFVDFLLSPRVQEDIPLQMFVFPAASQAKLPEVFLRHAVSAEKPAEVAPEVIDAKRDAWITTWTQIMLH